MVKENVFAEDQTWDNCVEFWLDMHSMCCEIPAVGQQTSSFTISSYHQLQHTVKSARD